MNNTKTTERQQVISTTIKYKLLTDVLVHLKNVKLKDREEILKLIQDMTDFDWQAEICSVEEGEYKIPYEFLETGEYEEFTIGLLKHICGRIPEDMKNPDYILARI